MGKPKSAYTRRLRVAGQKQLIWDLWTAVLMGAMAKPVIFSRLDERLRGVGAIVQKGAVDEGTQRWTARAG